MVGSAAAVSDGKKTPGKEAFLVKVLEVKGKRRGFVDWCWGDWILEQCFDVERTIQVFFFFFFILKCRARAGVTSLG